MSATQRARSGVPLDQRSALPTIPGIPAWGAVAVAAGSTFVGFLFDAVSGDELTSAFSVMYFLGCVLAVLAVRKRGLFTAVVQPPLLLFVAVPLGTQFLTDGAGTGLKDMAINVAYPLVNRFPLMLAATVVVGLIAAARVFLVQSRATVPARSRDRRAEARPARTGRGRTEARATTRRRSDDRDDRRAAPTRAPRPAPEPATAHIAGAAHGSPYSRRGYEDTARRHDTARREPVRGDIRARESVPREPVQRGPRDDAPYRGTVPRDPATAGGRRAADVPSHPVPQVRYRDRRDQPPFEG